MRIKHLLFFFFLQCTGITIAQPYPFLGYTLYDSLVIANHPNGCPPQYVTGRPDDSTWVNLIAYSVMTGYFSGQWKNLPGDDLLLEACFHHHNYSVRLILENGNLSAAHMVDETDWTDYPWVNWIHIFPGCIPGMAASPRLLLPLDFGLFGIGPDEIVTGIEITFLPTQGEADFAGAYIIVPPCGLFALDPDTTLCPGETINIDATTPNATYQWQDGSTNAVFQNAGPGEYWVKVTIYDCSKTDTIEIFEHEGPPDLGDDAILCTGETLDLDITFPGANYHWQDNSTQSMYTVTQAGTYSVTVTIDDCEFTDFIQVSYVNVPPVDLGQDITLCEGSTITLNATTPGASYLWQDQSTAATFTVTEPGEYAVTVDISGCTAEDVIEVDYFYPQPVDLGPDATLCQNETLFLDAFLPGAEYVWQDNSMMSGYSINQPGTYWVMVTFNDCSAGDTIVVDYAPAITLDLGQDLILCQGDSVTLDATNPGASYLWQDHSTSSTYKVQSQGLYAVTVSIGDCTDSDSITVSYVDQINVQLGADTTLCTGESILLDANVAGASYLWQDNSTASIFIVNQPGVYWVNATLNGCSSSDTIHVGYTSLPNVNLGPDTTLCSGQSILLQSTTTGASYLWQDNSTDSTLIVTQDGTYWLLVSAGHCTVSDTVMVHFDHVEPVMLGNDTTLCEGETLLLQVMSSGSTLEWQDHSIAPAFLVTDPGKYWVTSTSGHCSTSDTIQVDWISLASIYLGADTTLCDGQQLVLEADVNGANFLWQDNSTDGSINVTQSGTYWVQVSFFNCQVADTIRVDFQHISPIDLGADTTLCLGETLMLDATTPGATYTWQDNSTNPVLSVIQPGTYSVTLSIGECQAEDTLMVFFQNIEPVDLGNDTTLCEGQSLPLHAVSAGASFEWQDHSTQPDFLVSTNGQYSVTATLNQCEVSDTIHVSYLQLSSIHLGQDTTLCFGDTLTLQAGAPGAQYLWQDQSTASTFMVSQSGHYWVQVSLQDCAASDSIRIDYADPVSINLGNDTTLCPGQRLTLNAETSGATYEWQDQSTSSFYTVIQSGIYHVMLDLNGCLSSDTIRVGYVDLTPPMLGPDTTLCEGSTLLLDVYTDGALYTWQDHSTDPTYLVSEPGLYAVTLNWHSCTIGDTIAIQYQAPLTVDLGIDRALCEGESVILTPELPEEAEYHWQDSATTKTYEIMSPGLYWIEINDDCGVASDTILITKQDCECKFFMPNVFSPNDDHINDLLIPQFSCMLTSYHLAIFDRDGGLMFETSVPVEGWDGTVKSKPAQVGAYVFVLNYAFEDGMHMIAHGDVTLLR